MAKIHNVLQIVSTIYDNKYFIRNVRKASKGHNTKGFVIYFSLMFFYETAL